MAGAQHHDAGALQAGDLIGPYRVGSLLGEGGMGVVYRAVGPDGQEVALKCVKAELAHDSIFRRRFQREVRAAERVRSAHLVPVLDSGEHQGVPYMTQRLIRGGSLEDKIKRDGAIAVPAAVKLCLEVASGLAALHESRIVHRDLKPPNILLELDGSAYITDFGLAKDFDASVLTQPGQSAGGSVNYIAPEQIRGEEVTPLTDVYALGCVMFECISGAPPFADRRGMQVLWSHLEHDPPDPCANREDVPKNLGWALTRALEKDPTKRPPSAIAYARVLQLAAEPRNILGADG